MDLAATITFGLYLQRDTHENGMTLKEYADEVISGNQDKLGHHDFLYQFAATQDTMDAVIAWTKANNLSIVFSSVGQATVRVTGTVATVNELFGVFVQKNVDGDHTYTTYTGTLVIPAELSGLVIQVRGLDTSFIAKPKLQSVTPHSKPTTQPSYATYSSPVSPDQVAKAYKLPAGNGSGGTIGIFELTYWGYVAGWNQSDVNLSFAANNLPPIPAYSIINVPIDGQSVSSTTDAESMLDILCAGGVCPKAKIIYYCGYNGGNMYITDIISYVANDAVHHPEVLSISWGIGDITDFDDAMQSCAAKGITVIVSSGDNGAVGGSISDSATSPYCISAGGTNIGINPDFSIAGESAWSGSGGGISTAHNLPTWQANLTTTSVTSGVTHSPVALQARGIPDISAPADPYSGYLLYVSGAQYQYGGTSAAAPFIAGAIVRMNRQLGRRIGLPMSVFYGNLQMFNDIVNGDNVDGYYTGFKATTGWDAVTGLGTINGAKFYAYFRSMAGSNYPASWRGQRQISGATYPRTRTLLR
jgi:kumamolisin